MSAMLADARPDEATVQFCAMMVDQGDYVDGIRFTFRRRTVGIFGRNTGSPPKTSKSWQKAWYRVVTPRLLD